MRFDVLASTVQKDWIFDWKKTARCSAEHFHFMRQSGIGSFHEDSNVITKWMAREAETAENAPSKDFARTSKFGSVAKTKSQILKVKVNLLTLLEFFVENLCKCFCFFGVWTIFQKSNYAVVKAVWRCPLGLALPEHWNFVGIGSHFWLRQLHEQPSKHWERLRNYSFAKISNGAPSFPVSVSKVAYRV